MSQRPFSIYLEIQVTLRHKGNLALFLAYFLAIFWHMPGFISGMCQKFYCTILCSQISPKFLAYYRAIIPLWLGTRLGTYFSRDVASHSTSRKTLLCSQKLMPELNFYCSQDSPPEFYFYVASFPRHKCCQISLPVLNFYVARIPRQKLTSM